MKNVIFKMSILLVIFCSTFARSAFGHHSLQKDEKQFKIGRWDVEADLISANGGCYKIHVRSYQSEEGGGRTLVAYGDVYYPLGCNGSNYVAYDGWGFEGQNVSSSTFLNILTSDEDCWNAYVYVRDMAMSGVTKMIDTKKSLRNEIGVDFDVRYSNNHLKITTNEVFDFDQIKIINTNGQLSQIVESKNKVSTALYASESFALDLKKGIYDVAVFKENKAIGHRQLIIK